MKISILLPYKENFSPEYPGAVSLFVYETTKLSKYKKFITVYQLPRSYFDPIPHLTTLE